MIKIQNQDIFKISQKRQDALKIIQSGLDAIDPEKKINELIKITENEILAGNRSYNLKTIKKITVLGFGKAACLSGQTLEKILRDKITKSAIIGLPNQVCEVIETFGASHPLPSPQNASITKHLINLSKNLDHTDLVFVIVSGGGSAMLCYPFKEYEQGQKLYYDFLKTGASIKEMNTVRKHLSLVKGGGLAKILYPAQVVSLIISDIPGGHFGEIASGPTYFDRTTIKDAEDILNKYNLQGYELNETPKDYRFFKNIYNLEILSNIDAIDAMKKTAQKLGYSVKSLGNEIYDQVEKIAENHLLLANKKVAVISGGEGKIIVSNANGTGGRNTYGALSSLPFIKQNEKKLFISFASDGLDNSKYAGAIMDSMTSKEIYNQNLDWQKSLIEFKSLDVFEKTSGLISTGPTGSNVSDLYLALG